MFQSATRNIFGIIFFYMSDEEVASNIKPYELEQRFSRCLIVSGTKYHRCFIPHFTSTLEMKTLLADEEGAKMKLFNDDSVTSIRSHEMMSSYIKIYNMENMLLACITVYGTIGAVIERSDRNKDVYIKYMKQNHSVLTWPQDLQNECWVLCTDTIY